MKRKQPIQLYHPSPLCHYSVSLLDLFYAHTSRCRWHFGTKSTGTDAGCQILESTCTGCRFVAPVPLLAPAPGVAFEWCRCVPVWRCRQHRHKVQVLSSAGAGAGFGAGQILPANQMPMSVGESGAGAWAGLRCRFR